MHFNFKYSFSFEFDFFVFVLVCILTTQVYIFFPSILGISLTLFHFAGDGSWDVMPWIVTAVVTLSCLSTFIMNAAGRENFLHLCFRIWNDFRSRSHPFPSQEISQFPYLVLLPSAYPSSHAFICGWWRVPADSSLTSLLMDQSFHPNSHSTTQNTQASHRCTIISWRYSKRLWLRSVARHLVHLRSPAGYFCSVYLLAARSPPSWWRSGPSFPSAFRWRLVWVQVWEGWDERKGKRVTFFFILLFYFSVEQNKNSSSLLTLFSLFP